MRRYQKQLTVTAASAALLTAIGAAMAQQTAVPPGRPDSGQSNDERLTGIQDNTNNSYKTWPETLAPTAPGAHATTARSTRTRAAPQGSATTSSETTSSTTSSSTASDNSYAANPETSTAMLAPRSDRN